MKRWTWACVGLALGGALLLPSGARAFCGFYVGSDESQLKNDATMVVLLRQGTHTVLSMQNAYEGPPADFAMVVPVPVVLAQEDVRTLPRDVFARVDRLAAPRLVEYWEQDPCPRPMPRPTYRARGAGGASAPLRQGAARDEARRDYGVAVEARFAVGEYDIVILSAEEANGLQRWLVDHGYRIPDGAEAALRPYVAQGTKFFVARVDVERLTFQDGRAQLSPLRVHYESETFALPVRPRPPQRGRAPGPHRPHPRAEPALRGRELSEPLHPDEPHAPAPGPTALRRVLRRPLRPGRAGGARRRGHGVQLAGGELRPVPRPDPHRLRPHDPRRRRGGPAAAPSARAGKTHRAVHADPAPRALRGLGARARPRVPTRPRGGGRPRLPRTDGAA